MPAAATVPQNYFATGSDLTSVASAIRGKTGSSASLSFPGGFVSAIEGIPSGPSVSLVGPYRIEDDGTVTYEDYAKDAFRIKDWSSVNYADLYLEMPYVVSKIGSSAFVGFSDTLPEGVSVYLYDDSGHIKTVDMSAFSGETKFCGVSLSAVEHIGDSAFSATYIGSIYLPSSLESIGACAFSGCTGLSDVTEQDSNHPYSIGDDAFSFCGNLVDVVLDGASSVGSCAFKNCTGLSGLSLGRATEVGDYIVSGCDGLSSLTIGAPASGMSSVALALDPYSGGEIPYGTQVSLPNITVAEAEAANCFGVPAGSGWTLSCSDGDISLS